MLNYISAEMYKLCHKKSLLVGMLLLLFLESWLFIPSFWVEASPWEEAMLAFLIAVLPFGLFLAPAFAALIFDDQYGRGTLKNEVVFGIPRSRIYLGKLAAGMLVGTLCAAMAVGFYLAGCLLVGMMPSEPVLIETVVVEPLLWKLLLIDLVSAWLTWLAALSFAILIQFLFRSSAGALTITYLVSFIGVPLGMVGTGDEAALWLKAAVNLFYSAPYQIFYFGMERPGGALGYAALIFLIWVGGATAVGLVAFHRREIK